MLANTAEEQHASAGLVGLLRHYSAEVTSGDRNVLAGETPESLLTEVARAQTANPALGISGVHFFTFAALAATVKWVEDQRRS